MQTTDPPRSAADLATHEHELATAPRNARVGLWLFAVYVILYGGFMAMAAFYPKQMGQAPFGGINLAVLYGMLLIVAAFVLALLYMFLVRRRPGGE